MSPPPALGIALVTALIPLSLAVLVRLRRRGVLGPEGSRKLAHVGLGIAAALFPWLFDSRWPVWVLAALALVALLAVRGFPPLRSRFGGALLGVERYSWGDLLFPVGVAVAWSLAPADRLRFTLPVLVLALADALAAIIGSRYGRLAYSSAGGRKTWEGSLVFALVTFLLVLVPLLLFTPTGRAESLLIAFDMALFLMLVEALAWNGADNLLIPVAGLLLLDAWLTAGVGPLLAAAGGLLVMACACWCWRRWSTLDDAAVLACGVLGYLTLAIGGWPWLPAPCTVFLVYGRLYPPAAPERGHRAAIPILVAAPAFWWLLVDRAHPDPLRWVVAAAGVYATHLAAIGLLHAAYQHDARSGPFAVLRTWSLAVVLVLLPCLSLLGPGALSAVLLSSAGSLAALILFFQWQPRPALFPVDDRRWLRQSLLALAGSSLVLLAP